MPYYEVGTLIKRLREQKGLTQEALSSKVNVDKSTISRIEQGNQLPQKWVLDSLLECLGFNSRQIDYYLVTEKFEMYETRDKLRTLLFDRKLDEAEILIDKLSRSKEFSQEIGACQFILWAKATLMTLNHVEKSAVRKVIYEGLAITIPNFDEENIPSYLLNDIDTQLVNMLATTYEDEGDLNRCIKILTALKESLEAAEVNERERDKTLPMVLYNLSTCLGRAERHNEVIELCDYAKRICIRGDSMFVLPKILFNKAYALNKIGDRQQCKRLLYQAYCAFDIAERYVERDKTKDYAYKELGIRIEIE